jgi:hypothetical protein
MKKAFIFTFFLSLLINTSILIGKEANRKGVLIDEAKIKHSIIIDNINYFNDAQFKLNNFDKAPENSLVLNSEGFKVCIPLESIISIHETGEKANQYSKSKIFNVSYLYNTEEVKITGHFGYNSFNGKEVIGSQKVDFSIKLSQISNLEFTDNPINIFTISKKEKKGVPVRIKLWNKKEYTVFLTSSPKGHYSTEGYIVGGQTYYTYEPWIMLKHGNNEVKIEYSNLRKITFNKNTQYPNINRNYAAVLKDGTKLISKDATMDQFVRFIGYGEFGKFYISALDILEIEFI